MRLAICYSSKNQLDLTRQTWPRLLASLRKHARKASLFWCDGSTDEKALAYWNDAGSPVHAKRVLGGADAAIAWKLSAAVEDPENFTHIMLLENDVLLDEDWFDETLELFARGRAEHLEVGCVSPRSYADRILIQRDGFAVMHNIGAGAIVLTREAAEIILRTFRTGPWPANRYAFAQVSGIDIGTYACFSGNAQNITTDWQFEYQLLRHGLCALAVTPAKVEMIGQNPSLAEQGLELVSASIEAHVNDEAFQNFVMMMKLIREGKADVSEFVTPFHRQMGAALFYPHQVGHLFAQQQGWRLRWSQGWGPFTYVAGPGGASLSVRVSGTCSFLLSGGEETGANVDLVDTHSGFRTSPQLPPFPGQFTEVMVPGGFLPRTVALGLSEGGIFYGVSCADGQLLDASYSFTWDRLPEVA